MRTFIRQWFVLFGFRYLYSGANVILSTTGGLNNSDISQCNTTKTVICHIEQYTLMSWTIDNNIVADCTLTFCSSYPALPANAVFSYAPNAGIFNLTFNQVRLTDSDKEIKCSNGTSTAEKRIIENVKDFRVTLLESTGPYGPEMKVISGCISSSTYITFAWNKIKVNTSDVAEYTDGNYSMSTDNVTCSSDPICGSSETEQHTRLLIVTETAETDGGVDHYLQSIVTFQENGFSYSVTTESTKTFKLLVSVQETTTPKLDTDDKKLVVIIVVAVFGISAGIVFGVVSVCKVYTEMEKSTNINRRDDVRNITGSGHEDVPMSENNTNSNCSLRNNNNSEPDNREAEIHRSQVSRAATAAESQERQPSTTIYPNTRPGRLKPVSPKTKRKGNKDSGDGKTKKTRRPTGEYGSKKRTRPNLKMPNSNFRDERESKQPEILPNQVIPTDVSTQLRKEHHSSKDSLKDKTSGGTINKESDNQETEMTEGLKGDSQQENIPNLIHSVLNDKHRGGHEITMQQEKHPNQAYRQTNVPTESQDGETSNQMDALRNDHPNSKTSLNNKTPGGNISRESDNQTNESTRGLEGDSGLLNSTNLSPRKLNGNNRDEHKSMQPEASPNQDNRENNVLIKSQDGNTSSQKDGLQQEHLNMKQTLISKTHEGTINKESDNQKNETNRRHECDSEQEN